METVGTGFRTFLGCCVLPGCPTFHSTYNTGGIVWATCALLMAAHKVDISGDNSQMGKERSRLSCTYLKSLQSQNFNSLFTCKCWTMRHSQTGNSVRNTRVHVLALGNKERSPYILQYSYWLHRPKACDVSDDSHLCFSLFFESAHVLLSACSFSRWCVHPRKVCTTDSVTLCHVLEGRICLCYLLGHLSAWFTTLCNEKYPFYF